MIFRVKFRDNKGKVQSEVFQGPNRTVVFSLIQQKGYLPIEIIEQEEDPPCESIADNAPKRSRIAVWGLLAVCILSAVGLSVVRYVSHERTREREEQMAFERKILSKLRKEKNTSSADSDEKRKIVREAEPSLMEHDVAPKQKEDSPQKDLTTIPEPDASTNPVTDSETNVPSKGRSLSSLKATYDRKTEEERFESLRNYLSRAEFAYKRYCESMLSDEAICKMNASEKSGYESELRMLSDRYERRRNDAEGFASLFSDDEIQRFKEWLQNRSAALDFMKSQYMKSQSSAADDEAVKARDVEREQQRAKLEKIKADLRRARESRK